MKKVNFNTPSKRKVISTFMFCFILFSQSVYALEFDKTDNQKAMQAAELRTNGKAIAAKFVSKKGVDGYRVRIFKNGKVRHVFIALDDIVEKKSS